MEALEEAIRKTVTMFKNNGFSNEAIKLNLLEAYPDNAGLINKILASDDLTAA